jgi:hypothetical protein
MIVRIARIWFGTLLLAPVSFGIIWAITHPDGVSVLKELSGVIGAWVMAVIVFYFRREE